MATGTVNMMTYKARVLAGAGTVESDLYIDGRNLYLNSYDETNGGNNRGIFFRRSHSTENFYNCSILIYNHAGSNSPDGITINGYDGISFCTGSNSRQERMRVAESGCLLIATTTDNSNYKLYVNAASYLNSLKLGTSIANRFACFDSNGYLRAGNGDCGNSHQMVMPSHYYHEMYGNDSPSGTQVYVHYYNSATTSTYTYANLRVKNGTGARVLYFGGDGTFTWDNYNVARASTSGVGGSTTPTYVNSSGVVTACTAYSSASVNYANSAGQLSTARTIWGQSFNGTADITGKFIFSNDGSLAIYSQDGGQNCGNETVCIQTCFDGVDPSTHSYVTTYEHRCNLLLQPRGGQVYVGYNFAGAGDTSNALLVSGGLRTINAFATFEKNNNWLSPSRVVIGRTASEADTDRARIGVTNGNLHIDAYKGYGLYLNNYCSAGNVYFNGSTYYINGGTYNGNAASAGYISGSQPQLAAATEANEITVKDGGNKGIAGDLGWGMRHCIDFRWYDTHWRIGNYRGGSTDSPYFGIAYGNTTKWYVDTNGYSYATRQYNAIWNDYAEFRQVDIDEPGRVVIPQDNGIAIQSNARLQPGARIISDTYGSAVGQSDIATTPVGLCGRVLAYPYKNKNEYKIGDAVCSAPGGTIDIMTRDEIKEYPDRIIGIVNEIPDYDIWEPSLTGGGREPVHTNGRIWIDIR